MESLRLVRTKLLPQLTAVYRDANRGETERSLAADILADYAADDPQRLADLLMDADEKQFAVIYPTFKEQGERGGPILTAEIDKKLPPDLPSSDGSRDKLAKRQANAAVALLRMKQPGKVWPLLRHSPDPRVRSYLIHRLSPLGCGLQSHCQAAGRRTRRDDSAGVDLEFRGVLTTRSFHRMIARHCCRSCRRYTARKPIRGFMPHRNGCCGSGSRRCG